MVFQKFQKAFPWFFLKSRHSHGFSFPWFQNLKNNTGRKPYWKNNILQPAAGEKILRFQTLYTRGNGTDLPAAGQNFKGILKLNIVKSYVF